jgi:hypothetical protein
MSCNSCSGSCSSNSVIKVQPKDTSKGHFYVSLVKSALRILASISLIMIGFPEVMGIVEEII